MSAPRPWALRAPGGLLPGGRRFWRRVVPALAAAGVLHPVDVPALTVLASTYALWERILAELPSTEDPQRFTVLSRAASELAEVWHELARDFGLTPRSRRELLSSGEASGSHDILGSSGSGAVVCERATHAGCTGEDHRRHSGEGAVSGARECGAEMPRRAVLRAVERFCAH